MPEVILDSVENKNRIGDTVNSFLKEEARLKLVSPYISETEIFSKNKQIKSFKIICNARSSSTNPYLLRKLLERGIEIKSRKDIHAKTYIFKDKAIISSANATFNGLDIGTIEAASVVDSERDISNLNSWFNSLWDHKCTENVSDFSDAEWIKLEAAWNIRSKKSKHNLIDLINTKSIPEDYIFCFWHKTKDAPAKNKIADTSAEQGIVELPENIEKWDYWIEGDSNEVDKESIDKILENYYSKVCINFRTDSWPASKVYKTELFPSRLLDKTISHKFRNKTLLISLYRTDNINLPFNIDNSAIELINNSISRNKKAWDKFYETEDGKSGYCTAKQLYKLVKLTA